MMSLSYVREASRVEMKASLSDASLQMTSVLIFQSCLFKVHVGQLQVVSCHTWSENRPCAEKLSL